MNVCVCMCERVSSHPYLPISHPFFSLRLSSSLFSPFPPPPHPPRPARLFSTPLSPLSSLLSPLSSSPPLLLRSFVSFRAMSLATDSTDLQRQTLSRHRLTQLLAPHTTENPIFFHATNVTMAGFKNAIDQMAEVNPPCSACVVCVCVCVCVCVSLQRQFSPLDWFCCFRPHMDHLFLHIVKPF